MRMELYHKSLSRCSYTTKQRIRVWNHARDFRGACVTVVLFAIILT